LLVVGKFTNFFFLLSSIITFGLQSLAPGDSFYFTYDRQQKMCALVIGSNRSESFEFKITDGDKVGVIYISETNAVGLTHNGIAKG
jgi:hypothetical protein